MLQTQFLGAGASGFLGTSSLGAIASTAATTALQNYLKSIGKYSGTVTGVMNDATMAVIFDLLIQSAATVAKIPLLPQDIRDGISKVTTALKDADNKIKSITHDIAGLSTVISQFTNIQAAVRATLNAFPGNGAGNTAANVMLNARDIAYNAVAGQASTIQRAFTIFFPPPQPSPGRITANRFVASLTPGLTFKTQGIPATTAPVVLPSGAIFARSAKVPGRIRVAIPRLAGGLGGLGVMQDGLFGDCIFGDCGLSAAAFTEVASTTTPPAGGREVAEKEFDQLTGKSLFKKPLFWVAVAGGVIVLGGGGYWLVRRRKKVA